MLHRMQYKAECKKLNQRFVRQQAVLLVFCLMGAIILTQLSSEAQARLAAGVILVVTITGTIYIIAVSSKSGPKCDSCKASLAVGAAARAVLFTRACGKCGVQAIHGKPHPRAWSRYSALQYKRHVDQFKVLRYLIVVWPTCAVSLLLLYAISQANVQPHQNVPSFSKYLLLLLVAFPAHWIIHRVYYSSTTLSVLFVIMLLLVVIIIPLRIIAV